MTSKKASLTGAIAIAILIVLSICSLGIAVETMQIRKRAEAFLRDASHLQLRVATLSQVKKLADKYGGQAEPSTCNSSGGCSFFFTFDNRWLYRLFLAPHTRFTCALGVADNVLDYRRALLISGNTSAAFGAFINERLSLPSGVPAPFHISRQWDGSGERWRVHIDMTPDASTEQHQTAYSLNLLCLSKLGGCRDAMQLLPSITWTNSSAIGVIPQQSAKEALRPSP